MPYEEVAVSSAPDAQSQTRQHNEVAVTGEVDAAYPSTVLRLASGRSITLPTELLLMGLPESQSATTSVASSAPSVGAREQVIPLVEEQVIVGKKKVTTGIVKLHRGTETFTDSVTVPVTRTGWEIERTPIGQLYSTRPEIRQDGDTTIYPLVEERLVATREYFLIEEVRVRQVNTVTERTATIELTRDVLGVERTGATPDDRETR